ncbi:hypothetical protein AGLY_010462 [Aphis glycines]|uniref:Uncharacterized protein n=1 Tax=Aphis glycines TaxID=307491 RepID=A0A6G0TDM1_APHGL|nr:hypothetical protein AGLY_010462 [Aphis glycines]
MNYTIETRMNPGFWFTPKVLKISKTILMKFLLRGRIVPACVVSVLHTNDIANFRSPVSKLYDGFLPRVRHTFTNRKQLPYARLKSCPHYKEPNKCLPVLQSATFVLSPHIMLVVMLLDRSGAMVTRLTVTHTVVGSIQKNVQKMCGSCNHQFPVLSFDCAIRFPTSTQHSYECFNIFFDREILNIENKQILRRHHKRMCCLCHISLRLNEIVQHRRDLLAVFHFTHQSSVIIGQQCNSIIYFTTEQSKLTSAISGGSLEIRSRTTASHEGAFSKSYKSNILKFVYLGFTVNTSFFPYIQQPCQILPGLGRTYEHTFYGGSTKEINETRHGIICLFFTSNINSNSSMSPMPNSYDCRQTTLFHVTDMI